MATVIKGTRHLRATCNYYPAVTSTCLRPVVALVHTEDGGHQWLCAKHNDIECAEATDWRTLHDPAVFVWVETAEEALRGAIEGPFTVEEKQL